MARLGRALLFVSAVLLALAMALPAAAPGAKKKKAPSTKVTMVGFAVVPISIDNLSFIPPVPASLTKPGGTITDCGGVIPADVPKGGGFAGLVVVTTATGTKPFRVAGSVQRPDKSSPLSFGVKKTKTVASDGGQIPLLNRNGLYKVTAIATVKLGPRKFKNMRKVTASVTVSCPGA